MKPYEHPWHTPGMVAFCTSGWPRTEDFWLSINAMFVPHGTIMSKLSGVGIASMMTMHANMFLQDVTPPDGPPYKLQWMWITGDDHVWDEKLLGTMLNRAKEFKCDILAPLVCRKTPPFDSVMFLQDRPLDFQDLPLTNDPVPVFRVGTAGMLIQRRVFEAMAKNREVPPFKGSGLTPSQVGEDIHFCDLAQQLGFRIWVDPTLHMGHSPYGVSCWPVRKDGQWFLEIRFPEGRAVLMSLERPERDLVNHPFEAPPPPIDGLPAIG